MLTRFVAVLAVLGAIAVAPSAASASTPYYTTSYCWLIEYPPVACPPEPGWVGSAASGISGWAVGGTIHHTVAAFGGLDALPSNFVVTSATFSAYQVDELDSATKEIAIAPVTTDWSWPYGPDWTSPWSNVGGDFGSIVNSFDSPGIGNWSTPVNVTGLVADWVDGTTPNYGLGLFLESPDRGVDHAAAFGSFVIEVDGYTPPS